MHDEDASLLSERRRKKKKEDLSLSLSQRENFTRVKMFAQARSLFLI